MDYKKQKLVMVDDDSNYTFGLKLILEQEGIEVETFTNPMEALEKLKTDKADAILLDHKLGLYVEGKEFTSKEFLEEFRKFSKDTPVALQTAYSEEKPEDEMLEKLDIQAYIDKNMDNSRKMSIIKSLLKMALLVKTVQEQEKVINMQQYEEEFIGRLLVNVTNEMREQFMIMSAPKQELQDKASELNNEKLKEIAGAWQNSVNKMSHMLDALNFRVENSVGINYIFDTVRILTLANSSCIFPQTDDFTNVHCKPKYLIYILSEIVMYLYENKVEQAEIVCRQLDGKINILINRQFDYSQEMIKKINDIALNDEKISINLNNNLLEVMVG